MTIKQQQASDFRKKGMSFQKIGEEMDVSKQRAWALVDRNKYNARYRLTLKGRAINNRLSLKSYHKNKEPAYSKK